MIFLNIFN